MEFTDCTAPFTATVPIALDLIPVVSVKINLKVNVFPYTAPLLAVNLGDSDIGLDKVTGAPSICCQRYPATPLKALDFDPSSVTILPAFAFRPNPATAWGGKSAHVTFTKQMSVVSRPQLSVTVNMKLMDAGIPTV